MDVMDAISRQCTVRDYAPKEVPRAMLLELLHAAAQAPTELSRQPWVFCVFQGQKRLRDYSDRIKAHVLATRATTFELRCPDEMLADPEHNVFYNASTLLVICARSHANDPVKDCCLAAENLMLAAHALGLATCPIGFAQSWLNQPEVKNELGIAIDLTPVFALVVGFPGQPAEPAPRGEPEIAVWKLSD